jgi:hypothetical protein
MAESFTPNTDAEIAPAYTPEQEAQLIADGDLPKEQAQHPHAEAPQEELILGKFKTQDDLAEAYQSLEKKIGEPTSSLENLIKDSGDHYNEHGEMTEEHYDKFAQNGLSREIVDSYVTGLRAKADAETTQLLGTIGGQDNFDKMSEWMGESLPETEVTAYNNVIDNGSNEEVSVLLKGMYSRYQAATGAGNTQIKGSVSASPSGFRSRGEVMAAMDDPKYATDAAFRADVERKLSITPDTVF